MNIERKIPPKVLESTRHHRGLKRKIDDEAKEAVTDFIKEHSTAFRSEVSAFLADEFDI